MHTCPNCGYCPHCGRSTAPPRRVVPVPYFPPTYPYWSVIPPQPSYTTGDFPEYQPKVTSMASAGGPLL